LQPAPQYGQTVVTFSIVSLPLEVLNTEPCTVIQCGTSAFICTQHCQIVTIDTSERRGRTNLDTGRAFWAVVAKVAFVCLGSFPQDIDGCACVAHYRVGHHFHRTVRTSHHTSFATDTTFLLYLYKTVGAADGIIWADIGARGIFALPTLRRSADSRPFYNMDPRGKIYRTECGNIPVCTMRNGTGHLTRTAANTFVSIGKNKAVHSTLQLYTSVKSLFSQSVLSYIGLVHINHAKYFYI
jgi:hypothetical protein